MELTPLLDMWDRPADAGDPIGVLATTFAFDPEFFENNCLARFLAVDAVDEGTGSVDDMVARIEMEQALRGPTVSVLTDRSAACERSSLRWDLLPVHVRTGYLHSKVTVLCWADATRVIVGSANLTEAGYRRQVEIGLAADLGPGCLFPVDVLTAIADELESYLDYLGTGPDQAPAVGHARDTLDLFRRRIAEQVDAPSPLRIVCAPTSPDRAPLDALPASWKGHKPTRATHVSPFWDKHDTTVLTTVRGLLTGQPAAERRHTVSAAITWDGAIMFPPALRATGVDLRLFQVTDDDDKKTKKTTDFRTLHAKSLVIESDDWVSVLVGSSNHTLLGLGLGSPTRRHRELNIWLGAPAGSAEGKALRQLGPIGDRVKDDDLFAEVTDEDEPAEVVMLPLFFAMSRIRRIDGGTWQLVAQFDTEHPLDGNWSVHLPGGTVVVDSATWTGNEDVMVPVAEDALPTFLTVKWDDGEASWSTLVDNRHDLPPGIGIADLTSAQLLAALAAGKSVAQAVRDAIDQAQTEEASEDGTPYDPLRAHDSASTLLRRGRALAKSLERLQIHLSRPVLSLDTLLARLRGPFGPGFLADKVVDDCTKHRVGSAEAMFTIAEIALTLARVPWTEVLAAVDADEGLAAVRTDLERLANAAVELKRGAGDGAPSDVGRYLTGAIEEARRCLN